MFLARCTGHRTFETILLDIRNLRFSTFGLLRHRALVVSIPMVKRVDARRVLRVQSFNTSLSHGHPGRKRRDRIG